MDVQNGHISMGGGAISLDEIVDSIMDKAEAGMDAGQLLCLVKKNEGRCMEKLSDYTRKVLGADAENMDDDRLDGLVEGCAGELLDSMAASNLDYFKSGIKTGARLLLELLA